MLEPTKQALETQFQLAAQCAIPDHTKLDQEYPCRYLALNAMQEPIRLDQVRHPLYPVRFALREHFKLDQGRLSQSHVPFAMLASTRPDRGCSSLHYAGDVMQERIKLVRESPHQQIVICVMLELISLDLVLLFPMHASFVCPAHIRRDPAQLHHPRVCFVTLVHTLPALACQLQ